MRCKCQNCLDRAQRQVLNTHRSGMLSRFIMLGQRTISLLRSLGWTEGTLFIKILRNELVREHWHHYEAQ